ncbi:MAG: PEP-CTERM sorting domain-containing protein [Cyanobacteria bacterium P01_A01_bin.105]
MKVIQISGLVTLGLALMAGAAQAVTFTETSDAGETLGDAVSVTAGLSAPLESITGVLAGDADLFKIFLTGGQLFSATTLTGDSLLNLPIDETLGIPIELVSDPQLFLFDEAGIGVYANDDTFFSAQSALPSMSLSPTESGIYYLGIASNDYDPVSVGGEIFPDEPFTAVLGPTGPGGDAPLEGFAGTSTSSGSYVISLTGAQVLPATESPTGVPEPATLLGLLALAAFGYRTQRQDSLKTQNS